MLPETKKLGTTTCHKLEPQAKLPTQTVFRGLDPEDVKILKNLLSERVEYIDNPLFGRPEAMQQLVRPLSALRLAGNTSKSSDDSGIYALSNNGGVTKDERERLLFLRLNFCRRQVMSILRRHNGTRLNAEAVRQVLGWEREALATRSEIVRDNVPLVLAMAKRTRIVGVDLTDLISEGNLALLRAVLKFDCARGFKFSTYACRAILKSFSRLATRSARHRGHFPVEFDPDLEKSDYVEQRRVAVEDDCVSELKALMDENAAKLSEVEQTVIRARFALDRDDDPSQKAKTLEQVGEMIGVTKERVRQIQNKALGKLRDALEEGVLAH